MDSLYFLIVGILMALAVSGLVVGVANDAVNFMNSAIGSKAAPKYVILIIASVGIMIGALTSSGMMEVARSGVFYPSAFTFHEIMMLFLAVMFANVILLDLFNTFGLPTSTTVSLVFGLLGAAIAVASIKISGDDALTLNDLSKFINSGKAMVIISAILVSVVVAFISGAIVMYSTRLIFTFRYHKLFSKLGAFWCGIAFTAIAYFSIFKGLKSSGLISPEMMKLITNNMFTSLLIIWGGFSVLMAILQHLFKVNILKITILAGTFSLSLAFAGNDLVNFIGVPIAGYDSFRIASEIGDPNMLMGALNNPVKAESWFLIVAGVVMVLTLWFNKKADSVTETEINLAKKDEGTERFGSTLFSRSVVRLALSLNKKYENIVPHKVQLAIEKRFEPLKESNLSEHAHFDLIRATVNLTLASILIAIATSFKLPLSTTYVTFMVAMGSSLSDKAWGRESAVYRVTGVLTVISGWFLTAVIAFIIAYAVGLALMFGGVIAIIAITLLCVYLFIQSSILHKKREAKSSSKSQRKDVNTQGEDIVSICNGEVTDTMVAAIRIYKDTLLGVFNEDRKSLKALVKEANELYYAARDRKYEVLSTIRQLEESDIDTSHYYVQVVDYMSEVTKALVHITRPAYDHIDNNHQGLNQDQVDDLIRVNDQVSLIYKRINLMLQSQNFSNIDDVLKLKDDLFEIIASAIKDQLRRIKTKSTSTKSSILYLNILNETKTMVLQSRNLVKSQKYFINNRGEDTIN